jgi:hypothetical protein
VILRYYDRMEEIRQGDKAECLPEILGCYNANSVLGEGWFKVVTAPPFRIIRMIRNN